MPYTYTMLSNQFEMLFQLVLQFKVTELGFLSVLYWFMERAYCAVKNFLASFL